jgi:hypothetical protein
MNQVFFIFSLCVSSYVSAGGSNYGQVDFDQALEDYVNNMPEINFAVSQQHRCPINRAASPVMRQSSERGKLLHELHSFSHNYSKNDMSKRSKRQDNPFSLSGGPGYVISSSNCPFKQAVVCNSSSIYRLLERFV